MNLPMGSIVFRQQRQMARSLGRALTISEPATIENFKEHLSGGEYILGVIMLKKNNSCNFGVIDIDIRGKW